MNENAQILGPDQTAPAELAAPIGVRSPWNPYLAVFFLGTYLCAFLLYIEVDWAAVAVFALSWIVIPFLAITDNVVFDGKRISRTGPLVNLWSWAYGHRRKLRVTDIEQIDTRSVRMIRRGGRIVYRYRTAIHGRGMTFVLSSTGENFRSMIAAILPRVGEDSLDARSIELRDHLIDPKEVQMKAAFAGIPGSDVLGESVKMRPSRRGPAEDQDTELAIEENDKGSSLHRLANELRVAGHLTQAMEAFRRALLASPKNARLLYDFARCLQSFSGAERDPRLRLRSLAALRLAERYAAEDTSLVARIAETYVQAGDWRRGSAVFERLTEKAGETFLAARGLAEAALRDGKIAHVIHQFRTANRAASTASLRRWTRGEADYFSNLNGDPEYMEMEVSRVKLLESLDRNRRTVLRVAAAGFAPLLVGIIVEDALFADLGWAITALALTLWSGMLLIARIVSQRIPYDSMPVDE